MKSNLICLGELRLGLSVEEHQTEFKEELSPYKFHLTLFIPISTDVPTLITTLIFVTH